MNQREQQKKFNQDSQVKKSEFDRLNTNNLEYGNPISKGQVLLPKELDKKIGNNHLALIILQILLSIVMFFLLSFLGEKFLSNDFYDSYEFLLIVLLISVFLPMLLLRMTLFILKKKRTKLSR